MTSERKIEKPHPAKGQIDSGWKQKLQQVT